MECYLICHKPQERRSFDVVLVTLGDLSRVHCTTRHDETPALRSRLDCETLPAQSSGLLLFSFVLCGIICTASREACNRPVPKMISFDLYKRII